MTLLQPGKLEAITGQKGCYGDQRCQRGAQHLWIFFFVYTCFHLFVSDVYLFHCQFSAGRFVDSNRGCKMSSLSSLVANMALERGTLMKSVLSWAILQLPVLTHAHCWSSGCQSGGTRGLFLLGLCQCKTHILGKHLTPGPSCSLSPQLPSL